jgi:hypothetical protein
LSRIQRHALNAALLKSISYNLPEYFPVSAQYFSRLPTPCAVVTEEIILINIRVNALLLYFSSLAIKLATGS